MWLFHFHLCPAQQHLEQFTSLSHWCWVELKCRHEHPSEQLFISFSAHISLWYNLSCTCTLLSVKAPSHWLQLDFHLRCHWSLSSNFSYFHCVFQSACLYMLITRFQCCCEALVEGTISASKVILPKYFGEYLSTNLCVAPEHRWINLRSSQSGT